MLIIMITNFLEKVKLKHQGSSSLLPAHGKGGARATINNNSPSPSEEFLTKRKSKRAETLGGIIQNPSQSPKSDN